MQQGISKMTQHQLGWSPSAGSAVQCSSQLVAAQRVACVAVVPSCSPAKTLPPPSPCRSCVAPVCMCVCGCRYKVSCVHVEV